MTGHRRRIPWVVAVTAVLLMPAVPAGAHTHPTPIERAAPGVVYVEARAEVEVALVEHRQSDPGGIHIAIIQSTSNPLLGSASGFVVDPTGAIVTSGAITETDLDRAAVYAVNDAFRKQYGDAAPLPGDPYTRQRVGEATDRVQQRLEACYPPQRTNDAGGCVVRVTPTYVVYPYVTSQEEYGQLPAELLQGSTPDVALLRVRGATSMPTVALGESTEGAHALGVLGFTGIPGEQNQLQAINAHLAEVGGSALQTEGMTEEETATAARLADGLKNGMHGGPVLAEGGQVIGLLEPEAGSGPPPAAAGRLVDVGAIRDVLTAEGVAPRRGPVDTSFEAAMHAYKNGGFAAAIPNFKAALALFPGHAMAANNLAEAERNVAPGATGAAPPAEGNTAVTATGSAADVPWTIVLSVAALLLVATVATLALRRRRASAAGGVTPSPGTAKAREGQSAAPSGTGRPREAQSAAPSGTVRPREAQHAAPSGTVKPKEGQRERQAVSSVATGSGSGAGSVIEGVGSGRAGAASPSRSGPAPSGSAPSRSVPGQAPAAAVGDGSPRTSRASAAPPLAPTARRDASSEPATENRPAFCTSCGAHLAPDHRYCSRCGGAAG
jgi:hypothetical protein